jgi:hypothetical protein
VSRCLALIPELMIDVEEIRGANDIPRFVLLKGQVIVAVNTHVTTEA